YCDLDLLSSKERDRLLVKLNQTEKSYDSTLLMHSEFENLAASAPDSIALIAAGQSITYGELNTRASNVATHLSQQGIGPDNLVGIYVSRSIELIIATIGVLKAGAAYVPLDPAFPADRIAFMVEDSDMATVIFQSSLRASIPDTKATLLDIDSISQKTEVDQAQQSTVQSNNLAYVIYTSGSTGKPKGVMLEHRNVVNFFVAMDQAVPGAKQENRTWLAVTSLSFDISVLELLWTLNRGFKVVLYDEAQSRSNVQATDAQPSHVLDMSLFMWGNDDAPGPEKYRLLLEGSKYFDANGFSAVWTPERHFHAFGGPYPNPAVTGAAVAAIANNITIRAGSCVVPLHHPVRSAEEWAVVDNLSNGRVEVAAASGWNPTDFILRPENHANNKQVMYDQLEQVRQLWRGEKLTFPGPLGDVEVESLPRPVQKELPCWITTAGNPETWKDAGRLGLHVLTHLLGQTIEEVAEKIKMYRDARSEAGFDPATGQVALMLHTFIGDDTDEVRDLVREPMKDYLSSSMKLAMDYAWSFPAFKRPGGEESKPEDVDLRSLSDEDVDTILNFAFERYFEDSGLFGDNTRCMNMLAKADRAGVNEIACLMDFGVETQLIMDSLPKLNMLRQQMVEVVNAKPVEMNGNSFSDLINAHSISHLQCTPSTARMYLTDADSRSALGKIDHILLGGEALPPTLAAEVKAVNPGTLSNMYGPTETTIWSLTSRIENLDQGISIGTPVANTQVYVLDKFHKPLPTGIPGELFIAGDGVARGYLNRPELTSEKFLDNPFTSDVGKRMYATGDLAVFREDGLLDYQGRTDFQVKVRGYRIELGEIESRLEADQKISEAAVVVRQEDDGDQRLVAYVTARADATLDTGEMRNMLRGTLPEYMVPNEFVTIQYMPRTANGKLDRKALLEIKQAVTRNLAADTAPSSDVEKLIGNLWCKVLKLDAVGLSENFFDLGGHSLLVVQLHGQLKEAIEQPISLTDLYEHTTIKALAEYLTSGTDSRSVKQSVSRGEQRRALRRRRAS
ncbi:MAG: LLM class flavin-dependent oxidoreductase, partial [Gammaproteobacteria bacterium]|nr:LLM class flavin-dependent oxidoreductase [Gammaproteobacteria bacterium]